MEKGNKILIVDDEEIVRDSLHDWLESLDYDVETAESGFEALQIINRQKIKIMLTDLKMPGMDGIELMTKVKKIAPTISTVIITAHATVQTAITAMREGAYDYIEKPLCPEKVELLVIFL